MLVVIRDEESAITYQVLETENLRFILDQEDQTLRKQVFSAGFLTTCFGSYISSAWSRNLVPQTMTDSRIASAAYVRMSPNLHFNHD